MEILTAVIASATSLAISIFGIIQSSVNSRRLQRQFRKSQRREITQKILDMRIQHYPEAFELTSAIRRVKGNHFDHETVVKTRDALNKWRSGVVSMILSSQSKRIIHDLMEVLSRNPGNNDGYTSQQADVIWEKRNEFRRSLRKDIGILHTEDENHQS